MFWVDQCPAAGCRLLPCHYTMKEGERGPFFLKLRVRIKDNNTSLHGKFRRFLSPFSSKFPVQNLALYVFYIFSCDTRSEPGLPVVGLLFEIFQISLIWYQISKIFGRFQNSYRRYKSVTYSIFPERSNHTIFMEKAKVVMY